MKLKHEYYFQEYDEKYLAVADYGDNDDKKQLLWVNGTGKAIMELLHDDVSESEIVTALTEKYSAEPDKIETAVRSFVRKLSEAGLLES